MRPDPRPTRVLVLAGTAEAAALVVRLVAGDGRFDVTASLAGHTRTRAPLPCPVRTGGFGGVDGLVEALRLGGFEALVDATHPFAATMPYNAAEAAGALALPRVRLLRPPWTPGPDERWIEVDDLVAAAHALHELGARRVLLTTGRLELAPFAAVDGAHMVVRTIEPPDPLPLPSATVVLDRGPYAVSDEVALLREHAIDALVTKNSGGEATVAKLSAARTLGVPVVMIRRPPQPPGPVVTTVDEAEAWLAGVASGRGTRPGPG